MVDRPACRQRARSARYHVALIAAVGVGAALLQVPATASAEPTTIAVEGDSIIATGLPSGSATLQVARPDATSGNPVVIGQSSGFASPLGPFSVNTTTPTPLAPNGDCWQRGALSQALTPDLLPGDTVTVTSPSALGGTSSSTSATVPANAPLGLGPIPSCASIAPFAKNAVTAASFQGGAIAASGVAQPLASGVSVIATDGATATSPVAATLGPSGGWSATIPASEASALRSGAVTVTPVYAVADVATGAGAHISGRTMSIQKSAGAAPATPAGGSGGASTTRLRVSGLRVTTGFTLARARASGLRVSFVVPRDARVVSMQLSRGGRAVFRRAVPAGRAGSRQTIVLRGAALDRVLRRGRYTMSVRAGTSRARLGTATVRAIQVL